MNKFFSILISLIIVSITTASIDARIRYINECKNRSCPKTCPLSCASFCCNQAPYCGPYPRPLPGQFDSFKDNTKISFWNLPPCAPRNDSKERGYLYNGMWWDRSGVRYWAFRNNTNNIITIEALNGGEIKDISAGDVVNIARGESYTFRVQAPARRFELFNNDMHNIEIFINLRGDIDYKVEMPQPPAGKTKTAKLREPELVMPKF